MRFRSLVLAAAVVGALVPLPSSAGHACEGVALQEIPGTAPNGVGRYPLSAGWGGCTFFPSERVGFVGAGTFTFTVKRYGEDPKKYAATQEYACKERFARAGDEVLLEVTEGALFIWRETLSIDVEDVHEEVPTELQCPA